MEPALIILAILVVVAELATLATFSFRVTNNTGRYEAFISRCTLNNSQRRIMNDYDRWELDAMIANTPCSILFPYYIHGRLVWRFSKLHILIKRRFKLLTALKPNKHL